MLSSFVFDKKPKDSLPVKVKTIDDVRLDIETYVKSLAPRFAYIMLPKDSAFGGHDLLMWTNITVDTTKTFGMHHYTKNQSQTFQQMIFIDCYLEETKSPRTPLEVPHTLHVCASSADHLRQQLMKAQIISYT